MNNIIFGIKVTPDPEVETRYIQHELLDTLSRNNLLYNKEHTDNDGTITNVDFASYIDDMFIDEQSIPVRVWSDGESFYFGAGTVSGYSLPLNIQDISLIFEPLIEILKSNSNFIVNFGIFTY